MSESNSNKEKLMTYAEYKKVKGYASTGILLLDLVVGGGEGLGFPFGKMVNIIGDKSAGKTFLCWEIIVASFYKLKKQLKYNYDAAEVGDTFNTKKLYGVDLQHHEQNMNKRSELIEDFDGNTSLFLDTLRSKQQYGIYALDCLDALSDKDKEKQALAFKTAAATGKVKEGKGSMNMGTAAHLSKQYFRTKVGKIDKKKVLLIIISQVREVLGAGQYQKKIYRTGGKAMDFYAHTCLWLYGAAKLKREYKKKVGDTKFMKQVGGVIRAVTEKSKTPRPYRECYLSFYFDYGFDDIGSSVDYLFALRSPESQQLTPAAHCIPWAADAIEKTFKNTTTWIKDIGLYDTVKQAAKEDTGKATLKKDWLIEYIDETPELKEKADAYFGEGIERDVLITQIENDPKMYDELCERTVQRWEEEEKAVKSIRRRKYS